MLAEPHTTSPPANRHDERLDAAGQLQPHWGKLLKAIEQGSVARMQQRAALVQRQIRENGVTYNVYADPQGTDRLWNLELLPNLIPASEWQVLAAGVAQRARLLNAVLADLYGEQRLLQQGLLPTELVYGHNHYLWPCRGIPQPAGIYLHTIAIDLARAPDGAWRVLADRTQSPSGAGYALENRQILARAWPELFRDWRVQPLGSYVDTLRDTLTTLAPCAPQETPLAVLLTPGRFNETYFEHVYLAQQLGFPMVEGHDLTVRDGKAYLKTLGGLQRVHAILRRLDDAFCDPLELRADSALGVPGLLDAVRRGNVLVTNALGSGVLESPGLQGFLPTLAETLLCEALALPSVATWWCGEKPALDAVLPALAARVIKPAFPSQRFEPLFGAELDASGRSALTRRLLERPYAYVAQELVPLSQAPVWREQGIALEAISLRVYAVANADGSYHVMPGGLTRVATDGRGVVSMQRGGGSKDTWVLAEGLPRGTTTRARLLGARDIVRQTAFLPSSIAENLYWFGRYSERCDCATRLLRAALARDIGDDAPAALGLAMQAADSYGLLPGSGDDRNAALQAGISDLAWPGSLAANLQRLHDSGSQVRARLSAENWRLLGDIQRRCHELAPAAEQQQGDILEQLDELLQSLAALTGFAHDDMTRDDGWRFLMVGRHLERVHCLATVYGQCLQQPLGSLRHPRSLLDWLLEIGNSTITYRSRYLASAQAIPVLDLLLLDESNPHALLFQLRTLLALTDRLASDFGYSSDNTLAALTARLAAIDLAHFEQSLFSSTAGDFLASLAALLADVATAVLQLSDQLQLRHFAHVADLSQQLLSS